MSFSKSFFCAFLILFSGRCLTLSGQEIAPEAKARAAALVERMTLDEKLEYIVPTAVRWAATPAPGACTSCWGRA